MLLAMVLHLLLEALLQQILPGQGVSSLVGQITGGHAACHPGYQGDQEEQKAAGFQSKAVTLVVHQGLPPPFYIPGPRRPSGIWDPTG